MKFKNMSERLGEKNEYYIGDLDLTQIQPYKKDIIGRFVCCDCGCEFSCDLNVMVNRWICNCDDCRRDRYLETPIGRTETWLVDNGFEVKREFTYEDLRSPYTKRKLRFDFFAVKTLDNGSSYVTLIEINGKQHYEYTPVFHKSMEDFERQVEYDDMKKEYCEKNDINLIIIDSFLDDSVEEQLELSIGIDLTFM